MKNRKRLVSALAGFMAVMLLLSLIISLIPVPANAYESSSEIRAQINALKEEKKAIQAQIKEVKEQYKANEDEIADIVAKNSEVQSVFIDIACVDICFAYISPRSRSR